MFWEYPLDSRHAHIIVGHLILTYFIKLYALVI